ncbi:NAD(P)-binding protein [Aspergillus campestris IBT 28561]|uniref:NAD(P)-binding protein n=1 Tax=Aspergillus campestris (strain IBT 28561) TaxID=1392248 RepID=A0A2I1CTM7_ASPC2|nr:NAD(P)-binding protein [Aspergillus campestris IBT 28561]PKY00986.1 NAD(P)-binding protein [Aspergillus campestris IBT 28561]
MTVDSIQKVAIVGTTGRIGGVFAEALVQTGKHTVTGLTRQGSHGQQPDGVRHVEVDYDDEASIVDALRGQQFLVITLGVYVPEEVHHRIAVAAGKAGVPYIMPNIFGYPVLEHAKKDEQGLNNVVHARVDHVRSNGVSSSIRLPCGFWYEWSLATGEQWFGFTIKSRKVTFFDDGRRTLTVSTWDQCGRALAALLSFPESGASPSVADFKNQDLLIYSFRVSQRDMLDSLHRVLGTTDDDWEITYESVEKRIADGDKEIAKGIRTGRPKALYGRAFRTDNATADFADTMSTANEVLGLPTEDLDEATRRTVQMVEDGWNPLGLAV